ncbi:hypothetical protein AB0H36_35080 [Kribbella sp. NPDC050820]|uniref:hypothetical protein n=1 Tax=Kribbella sp. NPDC050820 TaxID=3155408 RepID=UPI0033CC72FF
MRRRTFTAVLASTILTGVSPAFARSGDLTLRLPPPTGRLLVGTTRLPLVDRDRTDPWNGAGVRELIGGRRDRGGVARRSAGPSGGQP